MEGTRTNIFENAICLSVRKHSFGTNKKVKKTVVQEIAQRLEDEYEQATGERKTIDTELLRMSKKIYDSVAMKEIRQVYGDISNHLEMYTIVGAMMRPGVYVVPIDHVLNVETYLREQIDKLEFWVYQLGEEYDGVVDKYIEKLGPLASRSDYPSIDEVKSKYSIEYEFLAHDVPTKLQYINKGLWQREQEKAQARVMVYAEKIEQMLNASMLNLIEHLTERLTDDSDGKRKKFASNMIDKAREFFTTFKVKNVTGAESLNDVADQGLSLLEGVDLDSLKDQAELRERVRAGFESIKATMGGMIQAAPRRAITITDDEVIGPSTGIVNDPVHEYGPPDAEPVGATLRLF